jgi:hypothetical protein
MRPEVSKLLAQEKEWGVIGSIVASAGGFMAAKKSGTLKVVTSGKRHYINVPSSDANALHQFLLAHNIQVMPPQPSCTGTETIDIRAGLNVKVVQDLLDKWS